MIRRSGTYEVSLREQMRGGDGTVSIEHFWKADELKGKTRLLAKLTLEPGGSIGFHKHDDEEEVFVILAGKAEMMDEDTPVVLEPGDTILTADGSGHAVKSVGDVPLEMLAVIVQY
ncbi:MAG: cupin domain-containing protein [Lentisphaeria bacterium]|nr:cupin domain-containing protein [Lentisphaeria bacterium]